MTKEELLERMNKEILACQVNDFPCYTCTILSKIVGRYGLNQRINQDYARWLQNSIYFKGSIKHPYENDIVIIHVMLDDYAHSAKSIMFKEFLDQYTGENL